MTRKRGVKLRVVSAALLCVAFILYAMYIHEKYFFNPLTFRQSAFLYGAWDVYKKPLSLDITNVLANNFPGMKVTNPKQVRVVIDQIEKTSNASVSPSKLPTPTYSISLNSGRVILQQILIYPKDHIVGLDTLNVNNQGLVEKSKYVRLSPSLLSYVEGQIGKPQ